MIKVTSGRVTVSDARDLDRAMRLVQCGRISYSRWVETLDAWARGEDVTSWDYGDAESVPERIVALFSGDVTTGEVAERLGITRTCASKSLTRLAERGQLRKVYFGRWRIGRAALQVSDAQTAKGPQR